MRYMVRVKRPGKPYSGLIRADSHDDAQKLAARINRNADYRATVLRVPAAK